MTDNNICTICLGRLQEREGLPNGCEHRFDVNCIREWSRDHRTCPICRVPYSGLRIGTRNGSFHLEEIPQLRLPDRVRIFFEAQVEEMMNEPYARELDPDVREELRNQSFRHLQSIYEAEVAPPGDQLRQPTLNEREQVRTVSGAPANAQRRQPVLAGLPQLRRRGARNAPRNVGDRIPQQAQVDPLGNVPPQAERDNLPENHQEQEPDNNDNLATSRQHP